jgi:hypothetical protein
MPDPNLSTRRRALLAHRRRLGIYGLCVLGLGLPLAAQQAPAYSRNEIDLGATSDPAGPSLRYTFNLSSALGVEARVSGQPDSVSGQDKVQATAGIKAGLRRGRWGFYGVVAPGWSARPDTKVRYGSTYMGGVTYIYPIEDRNIERSRFVLDTGVAVEYSLNARTFLRLDLEDALEPTFLDIQYDKLPFIIYEPGGIAHYGTLSFSAGHRFGGLREDTAGVPKSAHVDFGALFSLYGREHLLEQDVLFNSGYGGWVSYGLKPHLRLDASAFRSPHDDMTGSYQDGGKEALAFAGIKTGLRRDRVGIFFKARGGAIRFSRTYSGSNFPTVDAYLAAYSGHPTWQTALDLGGVVEVYPARHLILRAEAGPALVFYRATTFGLEGQTYSIPASSGSSVLLLFGGGFRF